MNIIVVSDTLAKTRSFTLSRVQAVGALGASLALSYGLGAWPQASRPVNGAPVNPLQFLNIDG